MIFVSGPGHGAPAILSQVYLEGTDAEVYPDKSEDEEGMRRFFKEFSFPGASAAIAPRRPPVPCMRAVSWAIVSPMLTGRPLTILISSWR